jgi:predicted DNA repair protein MutK
MAAGIFAILDDIATLLDDAAVMGKVAAKKTAGVLGDDLAVGAEKASGFSASRELPVLWAITKGSFRNKLIILPLAFLLSAFAPWLIVPILLMGGVYLAFEGAEKVYEFFIHSHGAAKPATPAVDKREKSSTAEEKKIKSAIITDFILSIEIVIIALGSVADQPLAIQAVVVTLIAFLATVGVYGLVALLVRMDDAGFYLIGRSDGMDGPASRVCRRSGELLVLSLPKTIRLLSVVGTIAMLMVGGGIFVHNIEAVHHIFGFLPSIAAEITSGLIIGLAALAVEKIVKRVFFSSN